MQAQEAEDEHFPVQDEGLKGAAAEDRPVARRMRRSRAAAPKYEEVEEEKDPFMVIQRTFNGLLTVFFLAGSGCG